MKRGYPPLWFGALLLAAALCWRVLGAPVSLEQVGDVKTQLWQMSVLTPSRVQRILLLWASAAPSSPSGESLADDGMDAEEQQLRRALEGQPELLDVWLPEEERIVQLPLESYVCGVVAAEMPAAYHTQALRAQAVAARTRALRQRADGGCPHHKGADICGSSACCQGYATLAHCQELWGDEYAYYRDRVVAATESTGGERLTYQGEIITVMYHAISGGWTENARAVFSQDLPYLVSVRSDGEESARGFSADARFTFQEAAEKLNAAFDGLNVTADQIQRTLITGSYTPAGRAATIRVGSGELDAAAFRRALGLRSTWFTITMDQDGVVFHQRGYGHGVGMSQAGANAMAAQGADYQQILSHYYPGTAIEKP